MNIKIRSYGKEIEIKETGIIENLISVVEMQAKDRGIKEALKHRRWR